jgi:hypothetical protein
MRRVWRAALWCAPSLAVAQGTARITGTVGDDLRSGPLPQATVTVIGTTIRATTDAAGAFVLDGVTPGTVQLRVTHPILDAIGAPVVTAAFRVDAGEHPPLTLSTMSFDALRARVCARGGPATGSAILVGRVRRGDDTPVAGASVSVVYKDVVTFNAQERVRRLTTGADGRFALCNLPESLTGSVQAVVDGAPTAEVPVRSKNELVVAVDVTVGGVRAGRATVQGRVTNRAGAPVSGATVAVTGTSVSATTAPDGTFSLSGLPEGTQEVTVKKIGFAAASQVATLVADAPQRLTVVIEDAQALATVTVTTELDDQLRRVGFLDRQRLATGRFITPGDIQARKATMVTDLLRDVNGLRVQTLGQGRIVQSTRTAAGTSANCVNIFVDRAQYEQYAPGDLDQSVPARNVGAIEVYPGPNDVPAEFHISGKTCATIVIWTVQRLQQP